MRFLSNKKVVRSVADHLTTRRSWRMQSLRRSAPLNCIHFLIGICLLISSPLPGAGESQAPPDGVEIRIRAHPETATIGDPIHIDLEVTAPRGYKIEIMEPEQQSGDFFILEFLPGPAIPASEETDKETRLSDKLDAGSLRHQARIVAAVYKTGTFLFPAIAVFITDDHGLKTGTESPSVEIEVRSILTGNDPDLKDLKKQAEIPGEIPWLLIALLAAALCVLGAAAWYIRRKYHESSPSRPSIPDRDPLDVAEEELRNLLARELPENGRTKKFYVLLSEIVKRILHAAYGIATEERTTMEIMDSLHTHSGLVQEIPEAIQSLLLQCDMVKFAKYIPSNSENDHAAAESFRILAQARKFAAGGLQPDPGSRQSTVGGGSAGNQESERLEEGMN